VAIPSTNALKYNIKGMQFKDVHRPCLLKHMFIYFGLDGMFLKCPSIILWHDMVSCHSILLQCLVNIFNRGGICQRIHHYSLWAHKELNFKGIWRSDFFNSLLMDWGMKPLSKDYLRREISLTGLSLSNSNQLNSLWKMP
jgi:hypothetical protein